MKKSKIIIPAAAILALSVGASVTGTVAWFTASRTASLSASNIAAINTAGDLGVVISGDNLVGAKKVSNTSVSLEYLQDASYDAVNNKAYVATLNNDGSLVTGTREATIDNDSYKSVAVTIDGTTKYEKIFVVSQWEATFSTSSTALNYLYFDPSVKVSNVADIATNSVFKSLRVAMYNTSEKLYTVWSPSTGDADYYYVNAAGPLSQAQKSSEKAVPSNYVSDALASTYKGDPSHVSADGDATVSEGILKTLAESSTALLSKNLKGGQTGSNTPTIRFTLWFEGLDPYCLATSGEISKTDAAKIVKSMTLGFYAVDSSTFKEVGA